MQGLPSISATLRKLLLLVSVLSLPLSQAAPRNVILIIGDGMDDHQITIARNYLVGAQGQLGLDKMALRSSAQVLTVQEDNPKQAVYVADSANSASSMATGIVTSRGRISTSAKQDQDLTTIIELAQAQGLRTGIISTASVTDATPAAFISHISVRGCQNPETMKDDEGFFGVAVDCSADLAINGGLGSIAEQYANSTVDVVLGGGSKHFATKLPNSEQSVKQLAEKNGFFVISQASELNSAPMDKKLLGLFSEDTMPVRWKGEDDAESEKADVSLLAKLSTLWGEVEYPDPHKCVANEAFEGMANLKAMTDTAIKRLSTNNDKGFFLVIESASIDKQSHQRLACGQIGEVQQLEEALSSALNFAQVQGDTLVLVTADHGQAAQLIPYKSMFSITGIPVYTPGHISILKTPEGSLMGVNYATNDFFAEEHTGVNVPVFANQAGQGLIKSTITQPDIFHIMAKYLGLE